METKGTLLSKSAITQLVMQNEEVQELRVLRLAGLGDKISSQVRAKIEQEIYGKWMPSSADKNYATVFLPELIGPIKT